MQQKAFYGAVYLSIATIGCYATLAQVILIREFLNIFYGNELCLGIVFGAWFLGISLGAFIGVKVQNRITHALAIFIISLFVLCLIFPLQIIFIRGIRSVLHVGAGEYIPILPLFLSSTGLIFPLSFIIGFVFPFSAKVASGMTGDNAIHIGSVFIVESIGSLIGGLLFSFFLVSRFQPFQIITVFNLWFYLLLLFLTLSCHKNVLQKTKKGCTLILSCSAFMMFILLFTPFLDKLDTVTTKLRWKTISPNIDLVDYTDSRYQHIDIGEQAGQFSIYLNGQYATAFPNEYELAPITHLVMSQHPNPKHVLLIGSGLGGILSEMLLHPIERLDYVELDQKLLKISGKYLTATDKAALADKRVRVFHQDGRYYVKNMSPKKYYDIIMVNTPDPSTAFINRFYTIDFFKEVQSILKTDGVFSNSVSSAVSYIGKEVGSYTGSLYRTLHEAFQNVKVTPGQTNFYFASNDDNMITLEIETLMERYKKSQVQSRYFSEYLFYTLLQPEQVTFIEKQLAQREDLLVNTDARPVTYFINLVLWDTITGSHLHGIFNGLQNVKLHSFLLPLLIALSGWAVFLVVKQAKQGRISSTKQLKINCLIGLATTGFTGIALEILLLYAFQNIYGYIYERMGTIVAIFMVGLAFGGYMTNRILRQSTWQWTKVFMIFEGTIGIYALMIPFIIKALSFYSAISEAGLIFLVGGAGLLTGMEFPLANKIFLQGEANIETSAGATDSADHIGAFLGALITGVILVPLLGIFGTCLILAVLNFSSFVLVFFSYSMLKDKFVC